MQCNVAATNVFSGHASLTSVPTAIPSDTQIVNLTFTQISAITVDPFTHLTSISELRLHNNRLEQMPAVESTADTLVEYNLEHNRIASIPAYYFQNFQLLKNLYLKDNQLVVLERFTFFGTISLFALSLTGNRINNTDVKAFENTGLTTLKWINVNDNQLTALPCFGDNRTFTFLGIKLQDNDITVMSEECLTQLQNVTTLELSLQRNNLSSIANLSVIISQITELDIDDNPFLSDFPVVSQELVDSSKLKILYLSESIFVLFPDIQMRETVTKLSINEAHITCIPSDRLMGFDNLETFNLHSNLMRRFPDDANCSSTPANSSLIFPSLHYLRMQDNELLEFPDLAMFPNLKELTMDFNPLVQLEWQTVAAASGLRVLDLRETWLQSVFCDYQQPGPPPFISNATLFKMRNEDLMLENFGDPTQPVYGTDIPLLCVWQLPTNWTIPTHNSTGHPLDTASCVSQATLQHARWIVITLYDTECPGNHPYAKMNGNECQILGLLSYLMMQKLRFLVLFTLPA